MLDQTEDTLIVHIMTVPMSLTFLRGQVQYMQAAGFRIHVVTSPGSSLDEFASREAVPATAVEMQRQISPLRDIKAIFQLWKTLRKLKPQIVHAHTPKGGLLGMISAFLAGVPVRIYHMRGLPYMTAEGRTRKILTTSERLSSRLAHKVFCVSHSLKNVAVADRVCSAGKIVVLGGGSGNGVDSRLRFNPDRISKEEANQKRRELGISPRATVILFVGRLVRDKGVEDLVEAWSHVRAENPDAFLVLVGPREKRDSISNDALLRLIEDVRVVLVGEVPDTSIFYAVADLVVLPTYREGFPNALLEAAAMRLPVVATAVPGCTDAVEHSVTGTLVPPRDPSALAFGIQRYLDHPSLRQKRE